MSNFQIRPATIDDAETLSYIGAATFIESFTDEIDGGAMIAHCRLQHAATTYANYLGAKLTSSWIAEHSETTAPVGYALNCAPDLPIDLMAGDVELKRIYILSKCHGNGLADQLMTAAISHARSQNAPRLLLGTYEGNVRAIAFYRKHGFETVGTRKFTVGHKVFDDIIMAKPL